MLLCLCIGGELILWIGTRGNSVWWISVARDNLVKGSRDWKWRYSRENQQHQSICSVYSRWSDSVVNSGVNTNWKDWDFKNTVTCPRFDITNYQPVREKVSLNCYKEPTILVSMATSTDGVFSVKFGDTCLEKVIDNCCKDDKSVPNVVHYVWYSKKEFGFFDFVSFMSVLRFIKPCLFLIHGNYAPFGKYWDYFVNISPNIIHVKRERPQTIFGKKLSYEEHSSDIMRIEALIMYGGIYLDVDQVILRSVDNLRIYKHTQGHEDSFSLASAFLMSEKNATFLNHWYRTYRDKYIPRLWGWNAVIAPNKIAGRDPDLIHIEGYNFTRPNAGHVKQIFKQNYKWDKNYGMHLYLRWYKNDTSIDTIRRLNTTIGSVCRHILFGNKELCST